jgi:hypothetical protein
MTYWIFNNMFSLFEHFFQVLNTGVIFALLSIVGFRLFHTYSGFMRYSSFIDLMRVVYGNAVSLCLALIAEYGMDYLPRDVFVHLNTTSICLIFLFSGFGFLHIHNADGIDKVTALVQSPFNCGLFVIPFVAIVKRCIFWLVGFKQSACRQPFHRFAGSDRQRKGKAG